VAVGVIVCHMRGRNSLMAYNLQNELVKALGGS
jgi:hypothetical protein